MNQSEQGSGIYPLAGAAAMKALILLPAFLLRASESVPQGCDPAVLGSVVCDSTLPPNERAAALVAQLTTQEKIEQLNTFSFDTEYFEGYTPAVERLGLPAWNYHSEVATFTFCLGKDPMARVFVCVHL